MLQFNSMCQIEMSNLGTCLLSVDAIDSMLELNEEIFETRIDCHNISWSYIEYVQNNQRCN